LNAREKAALTYQHRLLKTVRVQHAELLADTTAGLAPKQTA